MTNKKFKLAAMSLALTACVAASPLAANAESAGTEAKSPAPAVETPAPTAEVPGENTPTTNETKPGSTSEETKPGSTSEETKPGSNNEETKPGSNNEETKPGSNSEETKPGSTSEETKPGSTSEETKPGSTSEETKPGSTSEETKPGSTSEETKPDSADETKQEATDKAKQEVAVENKVLAEAPAAKAPVLMLAKAPAAPTGTTTAPAEAKTVATITKDGTTTNYTSFDDAVNAAEDNDIIEVIEDADTYGMMLKDKKLTIQGVTKPTTKTNEDGTVEETIRKPKLTFKKQGIALLGTELTFKDMQVDMIGIGSTPHAEWGWMTICAQNKSVLELDNTDMTLDGSNTGDKHAIYFDGPNQYLNVKNGSNLTIQNYQEDALEWEGGKGGYYCNITGGSTYTSEHNRSGFTGTFYVTVDDSDVNVIKSRGNGSNGSHYDIKNGSNVNFSGNGAQGLSAGNLTVQNSTVTAENNGMTGIIFTGKGEISDHSTVTITGTKGKSYWNAGLRLMKSNASLTIKDSTVTIKDNDVTGIFCDSGSQLTIEDTANVTVTNNNAAQENCSTKKDLAKKGGGLVVRNGASAKLGANTTINNNSAALAGADIFIEAGGKLTFSVGNAGIGDILDKGPDGTDCGHKIDGWYIDANGARWDFDTDADSAQAFLDSLDELPDGVTVNYDQATGLYTIAVDKTAGNGFALKAAHAELPAPTPDPDGPDTPTPNPNPKPEPEPKPGPDTSITPEDPQLPPVQDARADTPDSPVLPANSTNPAVQDAHALPQTGTSLFAALAMALSGFALTLAGAWASLLGKNSRH